MTETIQETQEHVEEPVLFKEKKEARRNGRGKWIVLVLIAATGVIFWPRGVIQGEAILQAERYAKLSLTTPGILKEILRQKGVPVKQGEVLARFDNPETKRRLEEKKSQLEILQLDKTRLARKEEFLESEKDRVQLLFENGVVGRGTLEEAVHTLEEAQGEFEIKAKEIESAEGEIGFLKAKLEMLELKAPFAGVLLTDLRTQIGSLFKEGELVAEIADPRSYFLEVLIPEEVVSQIHVGNPVKATFQASPSKVCEGVVTGIAPRSMDEIEKVFKIKHVVACEIHLNELPPDIKYGMRAQVAIQTKRGASC